MMNKADKKRAEYYNYYSYKKWGAAETYHLCIDSSVLGIDGTVGFIEEFVKEETKTLRINAVTIANEIGKNFTAYPNGIIANIASDFNL